MAYLGQLALLLALAISALEIVNDRDTGVSLLVVSLLVAGLAWTLAPGRPEK